MNYTPTEFQAFYLDDVIKSRGIKAQSRGEISLDEFLSRIFLNCIVGDTELEYDAKSRRLIWRAYNDEIVSTKFSLGNRFTIEIKPPTRKKSKYRHVKKEIMNDEIYNYRMKADKEEILSLAPNCTARDIKKARRTMALLYHTDVHNDLDVLLNNILTRRTQEINEAYEYVHTKHKKTAKR